MDAKRKLIYFGYVDLCTSSVQIEVTTLTTVLSMYYHLQKSETEVGFFSTYLWPVVNVVVTVILITINLIQIRSARNLIRAGKEETSSADMEVMRKNWSSKNKGTFVAGFIWFLFFGIPTFWEHGWPLSLIFGVFLMTMLSRGMVTWGIGRIAFGEDIYMPPLPPDLMEEFIEMQQQGQMEQQRQVEEQGWI